MLEEMEDTQINESVKEAFDSQITEFRVLLLERGLIPRLGLDSGVCGQP